MSIITCLICGYAFDAIENVSCKACPLHNGCAMVCCPNCGYTTINHHQSKLAGWAKRLFKTEPAQAKDSQHNIITD